MLGDKIWFLTGRGSGEAIHECVLVGLVVSAGISRGCCDRMGDEHVVCIQAWVLLSLGLLAPRFCF